MAALSKVDFSKFFKNTAYTQALSLQEINYLLNEEILRGTYNTPLGKISFSPEGEVIQESFFVAQVRMNPDGRSGKFTLLP